MLVAEAVRVPAIMLGLERMIAVGDGSVMDEVVSRGLLNLFSSSPSLRVQTSAIAMPYIAFQQGVIEAKILQRRGGPIGGWCIPRGKEQQGFPGLTQKSISKLPLPPNSRSPT